MAIITMDGKPIEAEDVELGEEIVKIIVEILSKSN